MFRVLNKNGMFVKYQRFLLSVRSEFNLSGIKLSSAVRIDRCVTKPASLNNANIALQNGGFRVEFQLQRKPFHVSASRQALPPLVIFILRPLSRIAAIFFGRRLRKWWRALPPEQKQDFILRLKKRKLTLLASGAMVSAALLWYYLSHLEKDPITGRTKFIAINNEQLLQIAQIELAVQMELYQDKFLPTSHPAYERVVNVANQLLKSNQEIPQLHSTKWLVTVVDEPSITNAFVLPSGHIFVFTGILDKCSNDDQLCIILAHEISHVLLSHVAEQFSSLHLMDILVMVPLVFIWAVLPQVAAIVTHWLSGFFSEVLFRLPFSRELEVEADLIGLQLTAKACYDVREASVFWAKMSATDSPLEWLSTHPSSETRQLILDALMPTAIQLRDQCKCPRLPLVDPRTLKVTGPERRVFA